MQNQNEENQSTEIEIIPPSALEAQERAQCDIAIATAHRFPRHDLSVIKKKMISFATLDEETAEGCFYVLKRKGQDGEKEIRGPSVRLAEIAVACYGNLRSGARVIGDDGKMITAQAVCHDLENNVQVSIEVKRRVTNKRGERYSDDMIVTTGNAACSIALRNAVFKVIPLALIRPVYDAARATAIGDVKTLASRREKAIETFYKMGVSKERVLAVVSKATVEDIDLSALETLLGIHTALKDGDTNVDEAFPLPAKHAPVPKEDAPKKDLPPEKAAGVSQETPNKSTTAESATTPTENAQSPSEKLAILMRGQSITFNELKAIIRPSGWCARGAKDLSDLSDENTAKIIGDWDEIAKAVKAEAQP